MHGSSANIKFSKTQLSKIVQLGEFVGNFIDTFFSPDKMTKKLLMEHTNYLKKRRLKTAIDSKNTLKVLKNASDKVFGTGNNNEIKDFIRVIKSLENRGILLKGTTTKITRQEGRFLNFLRALMTAGLPLMKGALTPLVFSYH